MGLDTYAMRHNPKFDPTVPEDTPDREYQYIPMEDELFKDVPNCLCGGMFSGNGAGHSFRGKVYDDVVQSIANETLYQEEIPNEVVRNIADAFASATARGFNNKKCRLHDISPAELEALTTWFRVVADNGGVVVGWW
jgi:hypothetical protein